MSIVKPGLWMRKGASDMRSGIAAKEISEAEVEAGARKRKRKRKL